MVDPRLQTLVEKLQGGEIDRRTFMVRAAALGVGLATAQMAIWDVAAQESSPEVEGSESGGAASLTPENLGVAGIEHSTDTSKGTINLYSSWPMTGASEQIGGDSAAAIAYAVEIYGGAAGGFEIVYEPLDDGIAANNGSWDAAKEAENATMVVNDQDAVAYIATYNSGAAEAAIPITNEAGMAQISPANTAVQLTKDAPTNPEGYPDVLYETGTRNYMRVVPADDIQGGAAANYAFNGLGAQSAYVLHDNQTYGLGVATVFRNTFEELGGEILGFEAFDPNAPEYQALMTKIASSGTAMVYLGAIVNLNASQLLQNMRLLMPADQVAFMGPDGLINQAFIDGAGDAAEGAYITFGGLPPSELENQGGAGAEWVQGMRDRVGHEPDAYSVYAFDCGVHVLQAIDAVGEKDRAKILDHMFSVEGFRGLLGTYEFDDSGDTTSSIISLNVVKDGQITYQETIGLPE
jgi:branched-chain amino acid transport system substrate-binding protein